MEKLKFIIVGAQKAGTTALSQFLGQHPGICMAAPKETHLFDSEHYSQAWTEQDIADNYAPFFSHYKGEPTTGEATPVYLYWPEIATELHRYNPQLKLILVLREPVERAISHWRMETEQGSDWLPMPLAFLLEPLRVYFSHSRAFTSSRRLHSYLDRGRYAEQLSNLRRFFPDDQLLILEHRELLEQHDNTLSKIFRFLGVAEDVDIEAKKVFSASSDKAATGAMQYLLQRYYRGSNRLLKSQLQAMGIEHAWRWLK
jgi:hypothetical protein